MNRHHPYGGGMYENRRGASPGGAGPERSHRQFHDRGGHRGRGRGRGGGGGGGPGANGRGYFGGGYGQDQGSTSYESPMPDSYSQWDGPQDSYSNYGPPDPYGNGSYPYNDAPSAYDQNYGSYEDTPHSGRGGRGGKRGGVPSRKERDESLIEERINRERPCRTLFIRNIKYETNSDDVRRIFEEHGEIKTFFDLIANRGMVFVTYYDLRAAERARERLQDTEIGGRPIDVHYSLPRPDEQAKNEPKDRNQGTLLVTLRNSPSGQPINETELHRLFSRFGDIKNIKPGDDPHDQRFIEFFDTRACEDAFERLRREPLQDGLMEITFSSDIPDVPLPPGPPPQRRQDDRQRGHDYDEGHRGGRGHNRGGRGRGGPPRDDWDRRGDDWDRDRDNKDRKYDNDYSRGGGSGGRGGRGRGRGGGGYSNDRYEQRQNGYGGPPPPPTNYGPPPPSGPPSGPPASYSQPNGGLPPAQGGLQPEERLEQARKVQQLLAALKQPQGGAPPAGGPPRTGAAAPPAPPPQMPQAGAPGYYPPMPAGMQPPYPGVPPPHMAPYGGHPPPPGASQPAPVTPQPGMAPPPSAATLAAAGIPPNILAMLQQAQHPGPGAPPGAGAPGYPYGMPPAGGAPPPGIPPGTAPQDYATLMAYLQHQAQPGN